MREAIFVVVVNHSVYVVNLSDIGIVHFEVLGKAVRVLSNELNTVLGVKFNDYVCKCMRDWHKLTNLTG